MLGLLALCLFAGLGCGTTRIEVLEWERSGFLERRGAELYLDGQPYRYVSYNAFTLTGCGNEGEVPDDRQLDDFFASLRPRSLVRTYAFAAHGVGAVERVVAAAKAHGHMLILVLGADNGDCSDGGFKKNSEWYSTQFRQTYLPWVQQIVPRFADEPAVGMWEVMKGAEEIEPLTLRAFFDSVGGEIHSLDPNHLVESGTHGPWAYGNGDGADYALIHASAGIDVGSTHEYDNASDEPVNLRPTLEAMSPLSKPVIIVEIGMFAGQQAAPTQTFGPQQCISWEQRGTVLARQMSAAFALGASGANIWTWFPNASTGCAVRTQPGDPLLDRVRNFPIP